MLILTMTAITSSSAALIERAQFKHNKAAYAPGHFKFANNYPGSFLDYFLHETECLHGMCFSDPWRTA